MTDFNEYLRAALTRLQESGDFQAFTRTVFAARWKCDVTAEAWQEIVPQLIETLFRPLIDGIADENDQNYCMVVLGMNLLNNGFGPEAKEWTKRAADATERLDDPLTRCNACTQYGQLLSVTGRDTEAGAYLKRGADNAERLDDPLTRCTAFGLYGRHLNKVGRETEAGEYLKRAADNAEHLDDPLTRCKALRDYGELLRVTGRYSEATEYMERAIDIVDQLDDLHVRCYTFMQYGQLLNNTGRDTEAGEYLKRATDAAEQLDDPLARCNAFRHYGQLLIKTGQYPEAAEYLKRAVDAAEQLDDPFTRSDAFRLYGHVLLITGHSAKADEYQRRSADEADTLDDPRTRFNVARGSAQFHLSQQQFTTALAGYRAAQGHLHTMLASNRFPQGINNILHEFGGVFDAGLLTADCLFMETKSPGVLFHGVAFADGLKAVSVREGLRRHSNRRFNHSATPWAAGPDDWGGLFHKPDGDTQPAPSGPRSRTPTLRTTYTAVPKGTPSILELPEEEDETKSELSLPVEPEELERILPDGDTVAVVFHFLDDDLFILPVRRDEDGKPAVLHNDDGYFWVKGARPAFAELLGVQAGTLKAIKDLGWYQDWAASLREQLEADAAAGGFDLMAVPFLLNKLLRLNALLTLIEPDAAKWADLHLVLLPDGPLYQLPLHTAAVTVGEKSVHLIDVVGSVRHALSLRTLLALGKVEDEQAAAWPAGVPLRGTAFVNPATEPPQGFGDHRKLDFAPQEVENLIDNSQPSSWRIFGERGASADWLATRANMKLHHPTPTLLWSVCHGGLMPDTFTPRGFPGPETVVNPSLLLADGPLSTARMVSEGYDLRGVHLWHNSCCLLGRLESADGHRQVEGYIAALTLLGCRRVTSAMWELADHAAAQFAKHFLLRLQVNVFDNPNRSPHAVAVSLKEAMRAFRDDKSAGDFDHPYYWAPYTLYGLG